MKQKTAELPQAMRSSFTIRVKSELHKNRYIYVMMIPVVLYYIIFCYGPMFGIVIAFKDFDIGRGIGASPWVGLKHFKNFLQDMYFVRLLRNTLIISFYDLLIGFPAPIIFALLLNEIKSTRFKRSIQTIAYLPHFISVVVICGMVTDFFSMDGLVTKLLIALGGAKINYLGDARYFRSIFVGTNVWQSLGWNSIIYIAALSSVDAELYEAAVIDGAGRLKQAIHITIPAIVPTILILLILRMGHIMSVGFEKIILLYNPGTYETADVISSYVYRRGLSESFQYSYSAAVGMFQSVVNLILLIVANSISNKLTETSLF